MSNQRMPRWGRVVSGLWRMYVAEDVGGDWQGVGREVGSGQRNVLFFRKIRYHIVSDFR